MLSHIETNLLGYFLIKRHDIIVSSILSYFCRNFKGKKCKRRNTKCAAPVLGGEGGTAHALCERGLFVAPSLRLARNDACGIVSPTPPICGYAVSQSTCTSKKGLPREGAVLFWRRRWDLNPRAALTAYEISRNRHFVPPRPSSSQFTLKMGQNHPISSLLFGKMSEK